MKRSSLTILLVAVLLPLCAQAQQRIPDTLAKIKAAKSITVAFSGDSLPFSYVETNNQPAGYSIDLCKRVIAGIGRAIGMPDLAINWVVDTVPNRIAMIANGKADLECANTTQSLSRMKDVDFSSLIFVDGGGFLVRADSSINGFGDLSGKSIAVTTGTTTEARLNAMLKDRLVNAKIVHVKDGVEGTALLESGAVAAFASDKIKLIGLAAQAKDPKVFAMLAEDLSFEPYAFMVPRNDSAFRLEVNRALTQVYVSGEIDQIFAKWLGKLGRPSGLLAAMYLLNAIPE
ncbi:MAG TPA: amino acid ABC transporter substrate-binding protein [Casimicrobiaceae bacterium]|nr:amino acid ABC transporter substrate-binding protein [Casimicrobiaceae bacterium]